MNERCLKKENSCETSRFVIAMFYKKFEIYYRGANVCVAVPSIRGNAARYNDQNTRADEYAVSTRRQ